MGFNSGFQGLKVFVDNGWKEKGAAATGQRIVWMIA